VSAVTLAVNPDAPQAMQLMVQGDKWEMFIPSDLAYGDGGRPPKIGGGERQCPLYILPLCATPIPLTLMLPSPPRRLPDLHDGDRRDQGRNQAQGRALSIHLRTIAIV
jgi:hypothetical protein